MKKSSRPLRAVTPAKAGILLLRLTSRAFSSVPAVATVLLHLDKRKQAHEPRPLDRPRKVPLVPHAHAGQFGGEDLPAGAHVPPHETEVLVVELFLFFRAELTDLRPHPSLLPLAGFPP